MWQCALCQAPAGPHTVKASGYRDLCTWCVGDMHRQGLEWCRYQRHKVAATDMAGRHCKACKRAQHKAWSERNRDRRRTYSRERARQLRAEGAPPRTNSPARLATRRASYARRREYERMKRREYYQAHREQEVAAARRRRAQLKAADPQYWLKWKMARKMRLFRAILRGER